MRLPKFSLTLHLPANVSAARSSAWDSSRLCRGLAVLGWTTGTLAAIAVGSIGDLSAGGVLNCRHPYAASWSGAAKSQRSSLHTTPCTIQASCRLTLHRGPLDLIDHEHLPLFQPQPKLLRLPKNTNQLTASPYRGTILVRARLCSTRSRPGPNTWATLVCAPSPINKGISGWSRTLQKHQNGRSSHGKATK